MLSKYVSIAAILSSTVLALGCSTSRDVEVTGEVSSASASGEIVLEFFDVTGEATTRVRTAKAASDGSFKETLSLEGEKVMVRAIADADGDDACSDGEQWAEESVKIEDDKAPPIQLTLASEACPVPL